MKHICVFIQLPDQPSEPLKHAVIFSGQTACKFSLAGAFNRVTSRIQEKDAAW
jgi:hypothetical protein